VLFDLDQNGFSSEKLILFKILNYRTMKIFLTLILLLMLIQVHGQTLNPSVEVVSDTLKVQKVEQGKGALWESFKAERKSYHEKRKNKYYNPFIYVYKLLRL
jgi:hypothetical protein